MKNSRTFVLFIISIGLILLSLIFAAFWDATVFSTNKIPLGMSVIIAFGFGIAGFITGVIDIKKIKNQGYWIGFIGNSIILVLFIIMMITIMRPTN